jgi:(p)ppGpp synthase/HD superfamily hydrolase
LGKLLSEAAAFAAWEFRDITRKGSSIPYVTHLFAVSALVGEHGGDQEQMAAALLHDWLEDIPGASEDVLRSRFGERVARIVVALTDTTKHPKPPWRARKEAHIASLRGAPADVRLVCAADKLHNVQSVIRDLDREGLSTFRRFSGGPDGLVWYFETIAETLGDAWPDALALRLLRATSQLRLKIDEARADKWA